ncbi:MAG: GNAT family N-acetyltransferase [Bradymonadaceae bacterium]
MSRTRRGFPRAGSTEPARRRGDRGPAGGGRAAGRTVPRRTDRCDVHRGRGKSAAVGMAVARRLEESDRYAEAGAVAVTAAQADSAGEVFRFATGNPEPPENGPVRFVAPDELLHDERRFDVVAIDEAAQLSVALLRRLVEAHPDAHLVFTSTTHGYEGTGRGFDLRFLEWLSEHDRPFERLSLEEPIRWSPEDPVEESVFDALLLDAEPADLADADPDRARHVELDREALARDDRRLRDFFGLLVQAHYRTTPSDLHRMLDAPNLDLHALEIDGRIAAATWVAHEGMLYPKLCGDLYWGRRRILGHALPETVVTHLGHREAGQLEMIRSVRIAVHPDLRRCGLGTQLVRAVHDQYRPDLFGTLFGAEPGLISFRREVGYDVVRVGASRDRRTGAPAVAMMRPVSDRARRLFETARGEFAAKLPAQLELHEAGEQLPLGEELKQALGRGLPDPAPMTDQRRDAIVAQYAFGPRTHFSAVAALEPFVDEHADALDSLADEGRRLVEARIRNRRSWEETRDAASMNSVPAAMRGLRRALRALVETVELDRTE